MKKIIVYDTTLRDGSQAEGVFFSLQDKISIALKLDDLGVDYIEGGYPGSNPKDRDFFRDIASKTLSNSKVVAFGSTRRGDKNAEADPGLQALLKAETPVVTIVAKGWDLHVKEVLRVSPENNLNMISDTVKFLKSHNREVFVDIEHFFDGYKSDAKYALKVVKTAVSSGADAIVLCDTNGGCLPSEISWMVKKARGGVKVPLGIHTHNDCDLAVANTLAAVEAGATHVQGTINGFGERCGNADLCSIIPVLTLKQGLTCLDEGKLKKLTEVSRYVNEVANLASRSNQPFVGVSAFAHKGGLHVDAITKNRQTYEHISPEVIGNERRILISELSGNATLLAKTAQYDITKNKETMRKILKQVQDRENQGYHYESAEASFEILVKKVLGRYKRFFDTVGFHVTVEKHDGAPVTVATVKISVDGVEELTAAEGDGPVNALDGALRKALKRFYPELKWHLVDFKVRVINPKDGTAARVRVIIQSQDEQDIWGTVGVSENIIEASWEALVDSIEYKLLKDQEKTTRRPAAALKSRQQ
ncbi:MAG: citramalate synthase [Candidatus Brocadiales bacterium]|nr:citramalate synthase [Candidatus Bathyanammoxibius amoris]